MASKPRTVRLPPEVNRILYIRCVYACARASACSNLPFKITAEEMYDVFGKYGAIRQVRIGSTAETKGTAFVVYEDIFDAKNACEHLSGFNVGGRYLTVLYFQPSKFARRGGTLANQAAEVDALRARVAAGEKLAAQAAEAEEVTDLMEDERDRRMMRK